MAAAAGIACWRLRRVWVYRGLGYLGGGSCLVRNFGAYDADRVTIYEDICATAKGYEFLCEQALHRGTRE